MGGAMKNVSLYLASRSPRRQALLEQMGVLHHVLPSGPGLTEGIDVDESVRFAEKPEEYVMRVAIDKARAGLAFVRQKTDWAPHPVLAADTTIDFAQTILGKPQDQQEAKRMLGALSGRTHTVLTAVVMVFGEQIHTRLSQSQVTFAALDEARIERYVQTGEPMDKAGAYGIQGFAAAFITRIEGSYSGIMGLPLSETAELLKLFGIQSY